MKRQTLNAQHLLTFKNFQLLELYSGLITTTVKYYSYLFKYCALLRIIAVKVT